MWTVSGVWFRALKLTLIGLFGLSLPACATPQNSSDGPQDQPEVTAPKIIAMGDIHGHFDGYFALLKEAGLVDENGDWIGGDTIFVQLGDVPDRGPDSLKTVRHLMKIQKQAKRDGGQVVTLLGNHETMMMTGDLRYVHPGEYAAFVTPGSEKLRDQLFSANATRLTATLQNDNPEITPAQVRAEFDKLYPLGRIELERAWSPKGEVGKWAKNNPALIIIGDSLFVHGGVSEAFADMPIAAQNKAAQKALRAQNKSAEAIINHEFGPLWYRGLVLDEVTPRISPADEAAAMAAHYGVSRIIVGHTPNPQGIKSLHGGRVIQIDTGISPVYGGTQSFLRIEGGRLFAHDEGQITELRAEERP